MLNNILSKDRKKRKKGSAISVKEDSKLARKKEPNHERERERERERG